MTNTHGGNVGRTFLSARSSDGNVRATACVLPLLAALAAVALICAGLPMPVSADGAMPNNIPSTCRNGGGGAPPQDPNGCGNTSGGGGCGNGGGNPMGACGGGRGSGGCSGASGTDGINGSTATMPVTGGSGASCNPPPNCLIAPCNSGSSPATDIPIGMAGGGYSIDNIHPGGEAHAGRHMVTLRRVDMKLQPNGGFPLAPARTYTNVAVNYDQNTEGRTILGPRWQFNYDMHLEYATGVADMILRTSWGEGIVLKSTATNEWKGDVHNGSPVLLVKDANGYTMTQPDPTIVYKFNLDGKLLSMRGRNGNVLSFTYDVNGELLTRIDMGHENPALDQDPRFVTLHYDTFTTFTFPSTNIWRTRLTRITAWNGQSVFYYYDAHGMLSAVVNARGEIVETYLNDYSYEGHPVQENPASFPLLLVVYARDGDGQYRSTRRYFYEDNGCLWGVNSADGRILEIERLGVETSSYKYEVRWADGRKTLYDVNFSRDPERTTVLDDQGNTVAVTTQQFVEGKLDDIFGDFRPSQLPKLHVNADGTTTTYAYLNEGSTTAPETDSIHVKRVDNPDGSWVEFDYDANYRVTEIRRPLNQNTRYTYDSDGNVTSVTDAKGHTNYIFYDHFGRVVKMEDPTSVTVEIAYNTTGLVTCTTSTEGRVALYEYNDLGQRIGATAVDTTQTMEYNAKDWLTTVTDMLGNKTVYEYDLIGRKTAVTDPLGNKTRYVYNNRNLLQNIINANDGTTTFTYDVWGRLTMLTNTRGHSQQYGYDIFGRMISETDALGKTKTYTYHDMGAGCASCGTGGTGKLASITDHDNRTTYFTYDLGGRIARIEYSGTSDYVEFTYDAAGRRTAMLDTRLDPNLIGGQTFTWAYGDGVTTETYPDGATIVKTYDCIGRRTALIDPDGNMTEYEYANEPNNKNLRRIRHGIGNESTFFMYDAQTGLLSESWLENSFVLDAYTYDSMRRIKRMETFQPDSASNIWTEEYTYNAGSMRTRTDFSCDSWGQWHKLYTYDKMLRLTDERKRRNSDNATLYSFAYSFDPIGNRTQMVNFNGATTNTVDYNYNAGNQLQNDGTYEYTYDNNGNLAMRDDANYDWMWYHYDRDNRLERVENVWDACNTFYHYDAMGRRIARQAYDGTLHRYYYDGLNVLMVKEKPLGCSTWRTKNTYVVKQAIVGHTLAEWNYAYTGCSITPTGATARYYHYDPIGNVTAVTGSAGEVIAQHDMEAYGNVAAGGQSGLHLSTKYFDDETALYFFNARWYDPQTGRFLSPDVASSGLAMGTSSMVRSMVMSEPSWVHPYSLGRGNPMVWIDNDGKLLLNIGIGALGGLLSCIANELLEEADPSQVHNAEDCLCQIGGGAIAGIFPLGFLGGLAGGGIGNALTELCRCGTMDNLHTAGQAGLGGLFSNLVQWASKGAIGDAMIAGYLARFGVGVAAGGITSPCCKK